MRKGERFYWPTEPDPSDIPLCDNCPGKPSDATECYLTTIKVFTMPLSQAAFTRSEQRGLTKVQFSRDVRRDYEHEDGWTGEKYIQEGALVFAPGGPLYRAELPAETWEEISAMKCNGPRKGKRRLRLKGKRELVCPLVEAVKLAEAEDATNFTGRELFEGQELPE